MQKTIDEKNADLEAAKAEVPKLKDAYETREKGKEAQLDQFKNERNKANDDLAAEQAKYQRERQLKNDAGDKTRRRFAGRPQRGKRNRSIKSTPISKSPNTLIREAQDHRVTNQSDKLARVTSDKLGTPYGEVSWINQRNSTV